MSQIFIETRGRSIDYRFLVKSPKKSWWRDYDKLTSFETPTLIIENTDDGRRIYLSAIPSIRKDVTNTTIRYTLVAELDGNDDHLKTLIYIVSKWLEEVGNAPGNRPKSSEIGSLLDDDLPEEIVEKLLIEKQPESEVSKELETQLQNFIDKFSKNLLSQIEKVNTDGSEVWWGGVLNDNSREAWISLVFQLLKKKVQGKALLLNLAEESDLKKLSSPNKNTGLLIINNHQKPQPNDEISAIGTQVIDYFKDFFNKQKKELKFLFMLVLLVFFSLFSSSFLQVNSLSEKEQNAIQVVLNSCPKTTSNLAPQENKLTVEQLAKQLEISEDDILSRASKCNENFKKWSATLKKGTWDFEIDNSQNKKSRFKFKKINLFLAD